MKKFKKEPTEKQIAFARAEFTVFEIVDLLTTCQLAMEWRSSQDPLISSVSGVLKQIAKKIEAMEEKIYIHMKGDEE